MLLHEREINTDDPSPVMPFAEGIQSTNRMTGIGGSDIAAIVGKIPSFYKRDVNVVYLEKIGTRHPFSGNEATDWGNRLEPLLRDKYLDDHQDLTMFTMKRGQTIRDNEHPFIFATPDGICFGQEGDAHIWEAKTVRYPSNKEGARWGEADVDGDPVIPDNVRLQVAWYNAVLESWGTPLENFSKVSVLIGGQDYREYTVPRDQELETALLQAGADFWENNVQKKVPPDPSHTEAYATVLKDRYPAPTNDVLVPASKEIEDIARLYHNTKRDIVRLEDKLKFYENTLRNHIGNNQGVVGRDADNGKPEFRMTWKLERKSSTNRGNILKELGVTRESEVYQKHTKTTHSRVLRKYWNYEEE